MSVYRKNIVDPYLRELEQFYQELRRELAGDAPNPNVASHYHANPEQFKKDYTEIDFDRVERCLARFEATVKHLKQLKKKQEMPVHQR